jgi:hypothetical protein
MAKRMSVTEGWYQIDDRLFTLDVYIVSGPMTAKFAKKREQQTAARGGPHPPI